MSRLGETLTEFNPDNDSTLTRRIYLIDCPGVVPPNPNDSEQDLLLRGVVRIENVENPSQYVAGMLSRVQERHVERTYGIKKWTSDEDFLETIARRGGRLLKGGEADLNAAARMVLHDFLRGRLPWYIAPPRAEGEGDESTVGIEGRQGRLGEMKAVVGKRKREESPEDDSDIGSLVDSEDSHAFGGFEDGEDELLDEITHESGDEDEEDEPPSSDGPDPGGS